MAIVTPAPKARLLKVFDAGKLFKPAAHGMHTVKEHGKAAKQGEHREDVHSLYLLNKNLYTDKNL